MWRRCIRLGDEVSIVVVAASRIRSAREFIEWLIDIVYQTIEIVGLIVGDSAEPMRQERKDRRSDPNFSVLCFSAHFSPFASRVSLIKAPTVSGNRGGFCAPSLA